MRWQEGRRSENVDDQRGLGGTGRKLKIGGGLSLAIVLVGMLLGKDLSPLAQMVSGVTVSDPRNSAGPASNQKRSPQEDKLADFVSVILADTEDTWAALFRQMNRTYEKPKLVLFTDAVQSACGNADSAVGPF